MMERFAVIWSGLKNSRGFLTAELQLGIAVAALLMTMLCGSAASVLQNWQEIVLDIQLQDAGRYIIGALEKDWGYDSELITVSRDFRGAAKVGCRTVFGGKSYLYTMENSGLYKQTQTAGTRGKNPLYIPDCTVVSWQVRKVSAKVLQVDFTLKKGVRKQNFRQLIYCLNGRAEDGA